MKLDAFMSSLVNTTLNLRGVLDDWQRLDENLASHYADEIVQVIAGIPSAFEIARDGHLTAATSLLAHCKAEIISLSDELQLVSGVDVAAILGTPDGVSVVASGDDPATVAIPRMAQAA